MLYDRAKFFSALQKTLTKGKALSQPQMDGFNILIAEGEHRGISTEWIAYILATAWHETAATMQPVRETLAPTDAEAIARLNRAYPNLKNKYWTTGYFGRGYVQLTWSYNYRIMGQWLGVDLVNNPSLALKPDIAAKIIYEGMIRGMFTAKKLSDYLNNTIESDQQEFAEYTRARAIVNGSDKATLIAGYALAIQKALKPAERIMPVAAVTPPFVANTAMDQSANAPAMNIAPVDVPTPEPIPVPAPPHMENGSVMQSTTVWASLGAFMTTIIGALSGLNPVIQGILVVLAFGFLFWIVMQRLKGNNAIDRII